MSDEISKVQIRPVDCLREGWELIRPQYWLFTGICIVAMLLGSMAPLAILWGPMMCGMYICFFRAMRKEKVEFSNLSMIILVSFCIGLVAMFAFQLVVDRDMQCGEELKSSWTAARRNLGGVLGLMLMNWLLSMAGMLCCYVGAFLVLPVTFAATAVAYRRIFPDMHGEENGTAAQTELPPPLPE